MVEMVEAVVVASRSTPSSDQEPYNTTASLGPSTGNRDEGDQGQEEEEEKRGRKSKERRQSVQVGAPVMVLQTVVQLGTHTEPTSAPFLKRS